LYYTNTSAPAATSTSGRMQTFYSLLTRLWTGVVLDDQTDTAHQSAEWKTYTQNNISETFCCGCNKDMG